MGVTCGTCGKDPAWHVWNPEEQIRYPHGDLPPRCPDQPWWARLLGFGYRRLYVVWKAKDLSGVVPAADDLVKEIENQVNGLEPQGNDGEIKGAR